MHACRCEKANIGTFISDDLRYFHCLCLRKMRFSEFPVRMRGFQGRGACGSVLLLGAGAIVSLWHWWKARELLKKAKDKRQLEQDYIKTQLDLLSGEIDMQLVEQILKMSGSELLDQLQNGKLNPCDVLAAYLYKACKETASLNCVTEVIRNCRQDAEKLSEKNPKDLPLYGLPVSLKECLHTKGSVSAVGLSNLIDNVSKDDGVLAKVLKECGAIPFVKTNLPQIMLSFESSNPIYGETSNPHNRDFAPGGSSAGESSIVGAGASVLGFGTDIAGSIRVPSHFCGICGLKPTKHRLSSSGITGSVPGQSAICATLGPMARDVETLVLAMRALLCEKMFELDKNVPPIKFREEIYNSKERLRIGYYDDDGYMEPVPACKRAVAITKRALEQAGHTLVPFIIPDMESMMDMATRAFYLDGGRTNLERLQDVAVDKHFVYTVRRWKIPPILRRMYASVLHLSSPRMARDVMAYGGGDKSAYSLWKLTAQIDTYKAKFWSEWKEKYNIDALICPVYAMVSCPKGMVNNMTAWMSYSVPYTLTNCPAGAVTVTKVTDGDIKDLESHKGHYQDAWDRHVKEACKGSINMPVAVQCVTPPWQEELCLRLMKEVEELLVQ